MPWSKISHVLGTEKPTNLKLGIRMEYDDQLVWWSKRVRWDSLDMLNEKNTMTGSWLLYDVGSRRNWTERTPKKTWWDCVKNNMENLRLSQKDVQFRNKTRTKGATGQRRFTWKKGVKTDDLDCQCTSEIIDYQHYRCQHTWALACTLLSLMAGR